MKSILCIALVCLLSLLLTACNTGPERTPEEQALFEQLQRDSIALAHAVVKPDTIPVIPEREYGPPPKPAVNYFATLRSYFEMLPESIRRRPFTQFGKTEMPEPQYRRDLISGKSIYIDYFREMGGDAMTAQLFYLSNPENGNLPDTIGYVLNDGFSIREYYTSDFRIYVFGRSGVKEVPEAIEGKMTQEGARLRFHEFLESHGDKGEGLDPDDILIRYYWWPHSEKVVVGVTAHHYWQSVPVGEYEWRDGRLNHAVLRETPFTRDTVKVTTVEEYQRAIRSQRVILLACPEIQIKNAYHYEQGESYVTSEFYDASSSALLHLRNLSLIGVGDTPTHFVENDETQDVFSLYDCDLIRLHNIKAGHGEDADVACHSGVIWAEWTDNLLVSACQLYGSGMVAVTGRNSSSLYFEGNQFYDCSETYVDLENCNSVSFEDCSFTGMPYSDMANINSCSDVLFTNCIFDGSKGEKGYNVFTLTDNDDMPMVTGCVIKGMRCPFVADNDEIVLEGNTMEKNHFRSTYATDTLKE